MYKEDLVSEKQLDQYIDEFYRSIHFERNSWLNTQQQQACYKFIGEKLNIKPHLVSWILIKRDYNLDYMTHINNDSNYGQDIYSIMKNHKPLIIVNNNAIDYESLWCELKQYLEKLSCQPEQSTHHDILIKMIDMENKGE